MGGFVVPLIIRSSSTTVNTLTSMMLRERATNTRAGWRQYFLYTRQKHCTGSGEIQIRPHLADHRTLSTLHSRHKGAGIWRQVFLVRNCALTHMCKRGQGLYAERVRRTY